MNEFQKTQEKIISCIDKCKEILDGLYRDQTSEKITLKYPRSRSVSDRSGVRGCSGSRNVGATDLKILTLSEELVCLEGSLDDGSLSRLLGSKLSDCISYLLRLRARVLDRQSRVLVTGDVNAGKSSFINALLRREILPTDQQPCTQSFCEIIPIFEGESYVHAAKDFEVYSLNDNTAYERMSIRDMQDEIQNELTPFKIFKAFLRTPQESFSFSSSVDFSLIDSPGLNTDIMKTMALFSKQEDIDVIVFLISAANHLTLSAREFLQTVSSEKAYVFIVVNKLDDIKNQEKCRRVILAQIRDVLPKTFEEQEELIHFVSTRVFFENLHRIPKTEVECSPILVANHNDKETISFLQEFARMESNLRRFIIDKRLKSKLLPVKLYLLQLLTEVTFLVKSNILQRSEELNKIEHELSIISPCFDSLIAHNGLLHADLRSECEDASSSSYSEAAANLKRIPVTSLVAQIPWCGILEVYSFSSNVHSQVCKEALSIARSVVENSAVKVLQHLTKLDEIALGHSKQVFKKLDTESLRESLMRTYTELEVGFTLPRPMNMYGAFKVGRLFKSKGWLSAASIGSVVFGYQPLLSLASRLLDLSQGGGRIVKASLLIVILGAVALTVASDLEEVLRESLREHYEGYFASACWFHEGARAVESLTKDVLLSRQRSLVTQFDNAVHQQRQLLATKDLQRAQVTTALKILETRMQQSIHLMKILQECNI